MIHERIEINPKIMQGKPVIRGTRMTVELILREMSEGADEQALLQAYPHLTRDDIQAALRYAADTLAHEAVLPNVDLPRHQRLALVRLLLDLDQPGTSDEIEQAWDEEIRARVKAVDEGRATGIPYEQIKKEMSGCFPSR
jgi:putative addiction module component (TIGR02574 family)